MHSQLKYCLAFVLILGLLTDPAVMQAQTFSVQDTLSAVALDTLRLTVPNMVPFSETILFDQDTLRPSEYWLDYARGRLVITNVERSVGTVSIAYSAFRVQIQDTLRLLEPARYKPPAVDRDSLLQDALDSLEAYEQGLTVERVGNDPLFSDAELSSRGSISRSLTAGSNRDLAVNSAMRLQLEGLVGDDIEVMASITDENIPIQPDGTTQQINDFDRVSIQLRKQPWNLTIGDYELMEKGSRFGNVYRNVLGINAGFEGKKQRGDMTLSLSKGRFHSNSFMGENGKQGPYQLRGQENERFIIVLAGSEKVYVNGETMQRGQDKDYTIDYNTGEVMFTPRRVITNNFRIVVDFEYAIQSYSRSLLVGRYQTQSDDNRFRLKLMAGREADNPNSPLFGTLDADERAALRLAGNDPNRATVPGGDTVVWNPAEVLYAQLDTVLAGATYTIFRRNLDSTVTSFRVSFSQVGQGQGDYTRVNAGINGNVFEWVAPDAEGNSRGNYAPVRRVALPKSLHTAVAQLEFDISNKLTAFTETAVSNRDGNRLSDIDNEDNTGYATHTGLRLKPVDMGGNFTVGAEASMQLVDRRYESFDRVYEMEYGREWDFDDQGQRADERLAQASVQLGWKDRWKLRVNPGWRQMSDSLRTFRQVVELESTDTVTVQGKHRVVWLTSEDNAVGQRRHWLRQNGRIFRNIGRFQPGVVLWLEDRGVYEGDSLRQGSFRFADVKPYLRSHNSERFSYELSCNYRTDNEFLQDAMREKSHTTIWGAEGTWLPSKGLRINGSATHTRYRIQDTLFLAQGDRDSESLMGLLDINYHSPNQGFYTLLHYQVLSESVARRDVIFVEVPPGMGQYEWFDYNGNGVQELNEFERSVNPLIANYQRVLLPTQTLVPAIGLDFSPQVNLDLSKVLAKSKSRLARIVKPLASTTMLSTQQKTQVPDPSFSDYIVRFQLPNPEDTSTISSAIAFRQDMYLWRNAPGGDLRVRYAASRSRQFLSSGFEQRQQNEWGFFQRLNFSSSRSVENAVEMGWKSSFAQLLPGRDFRIDYSRINPQYNWQFTRKLRVSTGYAFEHKRHGDISLASSEAVGIASLLNTHRLILTCRANLKNRNNLNVRMELLENTLRGDPEGTVRFELLEGNEPGRNVVWNVLLTQYLGKNLEMTVQYDGRASASAPPLHTGRMQLRALF